MNFTEYDQLIDGEFTSIDSIRKAIQFLKSNPIAHRDEDLALLKRLKAAESRLRKLYRTKQFNLVPIGQGKLAVGGRPSWDKLEKLADANVSTVVTLLRENEFDQLEMERGLNKLGMQWVWFPLSASELSVEMTFLENTRLLFNQMIQRLELGESIYIHCAAGVHRTGSFTNAFLQYQNYSRLESRQLIKQMREVTAREAIEKHWRWAENYAAHRSHD
ncbi:hypothetical protein EOL70_12690 [Leucothrix sargassi]|nr:hypothetical protein EOL70_12690 [Leucothrix sargassi]